MRKEHVRKMQRLGEGSKFQAHLLEDEENHLTLSRAERSWAHLCTGLLNALLNGDGHPLQQLLQLQFLLLPQAGRRLRKSPEVKERTIRQPGGEHQLPVSTCWVDSPLSQ